MARKKRAPTHDLTAPMRFVPASDGAWCDDLIDREIEQMRTAAEAECQAAAARAEQEGEPPPELYDENRLHIWQRYQMGDTRFNLDDPDLEPYLNRDKSPEIWTIRRLSFDQRSVCSRLSARGEEEQANWIAFMAGVLALEGVEDDPAGKALAKAIADLPNRRTSKHERKIKDAIADYAMGVVNDIGVAIRTGSMDLQAAEGKPFASPPGD